MCRISVLLSSVQLNLSSAFADSAGVEISHAIYNSSSMSTGATQAHPAPVPSGAFSLGYERYRSKSAASNLLSFGRSARATGYRERYRGNCHGMLLPTFKPSVNISRSKAKKPAQFNDGRQVAAIGVTVVDCLLGKTERDCEGFRGKKLFHVLPCSTVSSHMTAGGIGVRYPNLPGALPSPRTFIPACSTFAALIAATAGKMRERSVTKLIDFIVFPV